MNEILLILSGILGGGVGTATVAGVVALIRGRSGDKRQDRQMRVDIADKVQDMAGEMLDRSSAELKALREEVDVLKLDRERLQQAEDRLALVERENESLRAEVNLLTSAAAVELAQRETMVEHAVVVHDWIDNGAEPPPPARPAWATAAYRTATKKRVS